MTIFFLIFHLCFSFQALQEEVCRLKKEKAELENQVKFQAQINSEIKKLLVAAVGEDIETRVQLLTEDKLHLAKRLLSTAQTLSTHQEQIEWLAGQCEVWRSKFLASRFVFILHLLLFNFMSFS